MLEGALAAGILSAGVDVWLGGVLPTPAVAILTAALAPTGVVGGAVISASHNPFEDNGVKLFGADGGKLPDAWEAAIEARLDGPEAGPRPTGAGVGRCRPLRGGERRYLQAVRAGWPAALDLRGVRLVLDCAHGAMAAVAPRLFRSLGAEVEAVGARPDGLNINRGVGALHPGLLQARVRARPGAIGLAFDGDGDRLVVVDEEGQVRDGDHLLAACAAALQARRALKGGVVVSTVMANLGLERALAALGLGLVRVPVGDRHVLEAMRRLGANLGGEQSGHLVFLDLAPTGDGLVSALALLRVVRESGQPVSRLTAGLTKSPQVLVNVPVRAKPALDSLPGVREATARWEERLRGRARVLVRYSGTELLARVMVEGDEPATIRTAAGEIAEAIRAATGSAGSASGDQG
jgi:phosphoglucosamine mutase